MLGGMTAVYDALVVEDEPPARRYLVELLDAQPDLRVTVAVGSLEEAEQALSPEHGLRFDVAFVDIHLVGAEHEEEAGLALVRRHRNRPHAPKFVLATADPQHALEAFDLGVTDYLLKPFAPDRVDACVARLRPRITAWERPSGPARVVARTKTGLVFFEVDEVVAFQAEQRLAHVHARGARFDIDLTLSTLERTFAHRFLRVHRNWLVHRDHVAGLDRDSGDVRITVGGLVVPVSRDRATEVRRALLDGATGIKTKP